MAAVALIAGGVLGVGAGAMQIVEGAQGMKQAAKDQDDATDAFLRERARTKTRVEGIVEDRLAASSGGSSGVSTMNSEVLIDEQEIHQEAFQRLQDFKEESRRSSVSNMVGASFSGTSQMLQGVKGISEGVGGGKQGNTQKVFKQTSLDKFDAQKYGSLNTSSPQTGAGGGRSFLSQSLYKASWSR